MRKFTEKFGISGRQLWFLTGRAIASALT